MSVVTTFSNLLDFKMLPEWGLFSSISTAYTVTRTTIFQPFQPIPTIMNLPFMWNLNSTTWQSKFPFSDLLWTTDDWNAQVNNFNLHSPLTLMENTRERFEVLVGWPATGQTGWWPFQETKNAPLLRVHSLRMCPKHTCRTSHRAKTLTSRR